MSRTVGAAIPRIDRTVQRAVALTLATTLAAILAGCASVGPDYDRARATRVPDAPPAWEATTLPHRGDAVALTQWWSRFEDPLLVDLIAAAQGASGNLAEAVARINDARAEAIAAGARGLPAVDAAASLTRGPLVFGGPTILRTQSQALLQAQWEIDLFGAVERAKEAANARFDGRVAAWHEARVSLAAEVANRYTELRACETQVEVTDADAASRAESARLTAQLVASGFQAPANAALARASAAEASARAKAQRAECEIAMKGLVALTGWTEPALRTRLAAERAKLPRPAAFAIDSVPANVLAQRPDLARAERELAAASADIGAADADRYPRLALSGSIGPLRFQTSQTTVNTTTWSIGPSLSLPLFDAGRRAATADAARTRYGAAEARYREQARRAVQEVEEALVRVASAEARESDAATAVEGYGASFAAAEARWKAGLASQLELEEQRRLAVTAQGSLNTLRRERVLAWIALYRAAGGGWSPEALAPRTAAAPR